MASVSIEALLLGSAMPALELTAQIEQRLLARNQVLQSFFKLSAKTGEGVAEFLDFSSIAAHVLAPPSV